MCLLHRRITSQRRLPSSPSCLCANASTEPHTQLHVHLWPCWCVCVCELERERDQCSVTWLRVSQTFKNSITESDEKTHAHTCARSRRRTSQRLQWATETCFSLPCLYLSLSLPIFQDVYPPYLSLLSSTLKKKILIKTSLYRGKIQLRCGFKLGPCHKCNITVRLLQKSISPG